MQNFPRFARDFVRYSSDLCREVRESHGEMYRNVRESQGIKIALTDGNPVYGIEVEGKELECLPPEHSITY